MKTGTKRVTMGTEKIINNKISLMNNNGIWKHLDIS